MLQKFIQEALASSIHGRQTAKIYCELCDFFGARPLLPNRSQLLNPRTNQAAFQNEEERIPVLFNAYP